MPKKSFTIIVITIIAIFLGIGFLISRVGGYYSGPAKLSVSEEIGDLGTIKSDQPQTHIFTLKNEGGETLIIERVQAPCGCTATVLSDKNLLPGKTTQLEVTFNPRGYDGEVTQSVYIYSNDPKTPRMKIAIKAIVERESSPKIHTSTSKWDLGLLSIGDSSSLLIKVSNQGDLVLEIENIILPNQVSYQQEVPEFPLLLAPGEEIELSFVYDSHGQERGAIREYIRLVTNDRNRRNVTLMIEGYIIEKAEMISIQPLQKFIIAEEMENKWYEAKFLIKNNSASELRNFSITSSQDYITPNNQEITLSPGEEKEITIRIEQQSLSNVDIEEILQEYIYFKIAVPIDINFALP